MSEAPGGEARRKLVALTALVAIAVALGGIALATGGDDSGGLRIETGAVAGAAPTDITVFVEDPDVNVPETAKGRATVELECFDSRDRRVMRSRIRWPLTDTDEGAFDPHVHQGVAEGQPERIARCRLTGTEGPLEGRVSAPR